MGGEVIGSVPFDATDVGCRGDGGAFAGEVPAAVGFCGGGGGGGGGEGEGDDVGVVEEDPEDFFGDADDFVAPDPVGSGVVD